MDLGIARRATAVPRLQAPRPYATGPAEAVGVGVVALGAAGSAALMSATGLLYLTTLVAFALAVTSRLAES